MYRDAVYISVVPSLIPNVWFQHEGIEVTLTENPRSKSRVEDLTFGAEFSDHMLLVDWTKIHGWDVPKIVPFGNLSLSPAVSALHYSTEVSCFVESEYNKILIIPFIMQYIRSYVCTVL